MCLVDRITFSCSHIENIYTNECGTPGNRCAKQINTSTSDSACRKCLAKILPAERRTAVADLFGNLQDYLTYCFDLTDTFDHDILAPAVQRIAQLIEDQKSYVLCELELKLAIEVQKKKEFSEVDSSGWV
jgi:hypothetical protein